jgi:probable rRNA maturation factor
MIDLDNRTDLAFDLEKLEAISERLTSQEVELIIADDTTMITVNTEHRGKEQLTDVLSFPMETPYTQESVFGFPLGSIMISDTLVKEKASYLGHTIQDEISLLFIHGLLHLLGYDHEVDDGEMRQREEKLIKEFDLPESLIVRTEEK